MADQNIDQAVMDLLVKVQQKKKEIENAKERPVWRTSCSFGKDPNSTTDRVNIQVVKDPRKLIEIWAFLTSQQNSMLNAANDLGLDFDGMWQNYTFAEWKRDLQTRAGQLRIEKKQKELDDLDARVNALVTPEQRRVMELSVLQQLLK
jgi:cell division protein FtsL